MIILKKGMLLPPGSDSGGGGGGGIWGGPPPPPPVDALELANYWSRKKRFVKKHKISVIFMRVYKVANSPAHFHTA